MIKPLVLSDEQYLQIAKDLRQAHFGDPGRLFYIQSFLERGSKIYQSDKNYLLQKRLQLTQIIIKMAEPIKPAKIIQIQNCAQCNQELRFSEKSVRHKNDWYHNTCFQATMPKIETQNTTIREKPKPTQIQDKPTTTQTTKTPKAKVDPILVLLAVAIFAMLIYVAYSTLNYLSISVIAIAAALSLYQIASRKLPSKQHAHGKHSASFYSIAAMASPFVLGTIMVYDGSFAFDDIAQTIFVWGLALSFWQTMIFVPLAIRNVSIEALLKDPVDFPKISVLVPAYNEGRVIRTTIESLLSTDYPDKEIIVIDDGSTDRTLAIASEYKDKIKVIHKENGGKASALNMGLLYATGKIITIIDADTIIGHSSLRHITKCLSNENVAAVAGNIKIRNKTNWLTWCQALEYLAGIQIMRRGLEYFGAITVVPGALGAFRKSKLEEAGTYHKDTLVEDFDVSMKVLRSGVVINASNKLLAYTQGPQTLRDFYKQRKRWYRGNLQVLKRHRDVLFNPRFGYLQKFAYPMMIIHMLFIPIVSILVWIVTAYQIIVGHYGFVLSTAMMFIVLQHLISTMAVRMDHDDKKLILFSVFLVVGYKQLTDLLQVKAVFEELFGAKAKWTSAQRVQQ